MSDIDDLRREIAKARSNATAKIGRLKKKGINLEGKDSDPRRAPGVQKAYTKAQAESYLQKLKTFNNRANGYVRLSEGYVTRAEVNELAALNRRYNLKGQRNYDRVKDTILHNGETVAQRDAKLSPATNLRRANGHASRRMYSPVNNRPENIAGPEALKKLIAQRKKQLAKDFEPIETFKSRRQAMGMVRSYGDKKLIDAVRSLTNEQFRMLWNYGPFASDASRGYERQKLLAQQGSDAKYDSVMSDAKEDIYNAISWAKENVHEKKPRANRRRKK